MRDGYQADRFHLCSKLDTRPGSSNNLCMNSHRVSFVVFPVLLFLVTAITAGLLSAPRLQDNLPPGAFRVGPQAQLQEIEPPVPNPGEGIDFTIRAIDGSSGRPLARMRIELKRNPFVNSPQVAADRRRWTFTANTDAQGVAILTGMVADRYTINPVDRKSTRLNSSHRL